MNRESILFLICNFIVITKRNRSWSTSKSDPAIRIINNSGSKNVINNGYKMRSKILCFIDCRSRSFNTLQAPYEVLHIGAKELKPSSILNGHCEIMLCELSLYLLFFSMLLKHFPHNVLSRVASEGKIGAQTSRILLHSA